MADAEQQNGNEQHIAPDGGADTDLVFELNFVPSWARKPPDSARFSSSSGEDGRRGRRDRGPGARDTRGPGNRPMRDRPRQQDRRGPHPDRRDQPYGRPREQRYPEHDSREHLERPEDLGISLRFIPSRAQLSAVIQQIRTSKQAYPLMDTASLFLGNLKFCHVVIECARGATAEDESDIFQCKTCKTLSLDRQVMVEHIVSEHFSDYFEKQEIEIEPPTGKFDFIAKCGFSGVLLGPPNHHSYSEKVKEVHRNRFSNMSLDAYRRRIQVVRDPELVDKWKQESRKRAVYTLKNPPEGSKNEPVDQASAESHMNGTVVPELISSTKRIVCPMTVATTVRDQRLLGALRTVWDREVRHPFSLMLALRGACRGGHLHIFKARKGYSFVTSIRPVPLDPDKAIESICEALKHLKKHPGCTRKALVEALKPGTPVDSPEIAEILSPLRWLIERGHIIEFFNGALAVPLR